MEVDETTQPVTNFRDVTLIAFGARKGVCFRSGHLRNLYSRADITSQFRTIITFCPEPDQFHDASLSHLVHIPFDGPDWNAYSADKAGVRNWICKVLVSVSEALDIGAFPILFHCFSGKDRTGVIAATLLYIIGCDRDLLLKDYLLSDGKLHPEDMNKYLSMIQSTVLPIVPRDALDAIKRVLSGSGGPVLRIGYLPRGNTITHESFTWTIDALGRLYQCSGTLKIKDEHLNPELKLKMFYEEDVVHTASYHNVAISKTASDRWVPILPVAFAGIPSRLNEVIASQGAVRELVSFYKSLLQLIVRFRDVLAPDVAQATVTEVPITVILSYLSESPHGIQRPDLIQMRHYHGISKEEESEVHYISNT